MNEPLWRKVLVWLVLISCSGTLALTIGGLAEDHVIISNQTGLPIARIEIDHRKLEGSGTVVSDKILVSVTPARHHLKVVFRGGADVDWPNFDFRGIHEIILERLQNKISARIE